jgi:hypothetical protein
MAIDFFPVACALLPIAMASLPVAFAVLPAATAPTSFVVPAGTLPAAKTPL